MPERDESRSVPPADTPTAPDVVPRRPGPDQHPVPATPPPGRPELTAALRWAWERFTTNAGLLVGVAVLWALVVAAVAAVCALVIGLLTWVALFAADTPTGGGVALTPLVAALSIFAGLLVAVLAAAALSCWLNGLLIIADGSAPDLTDFFRPTAFGPILVISLVVSALDVAAQLLFSDTLGSDWLSTAFSVVLGYCTLWMVYFAADLRAPARGAAARGFRLTTRRPGPTLVVYLVSILLALAGTLLVLAGLLVALPLAGLLTIYYFRALTGRPVAANAR